MIVAATIVGTGLVGGVYAAFSIMVIPALRRLPDAEAAAAMIAINRAAERGPFLVLFGGTAIAAATLGATAVGRPVTSDLAVAGASLASTAITVAVNVPMNRRLDVDGARFWPTYARRWTRWNTARALAATASVAVASVATRG
ncbi:hypothetical protein GCM10011331_06860 [Flavimobilis marinus]|uniref:Uncharacterized membrane protein n=1 Tax=Flavimobilis marinus TaxID=285351 RepID=A0A1I2CZ20_9MICO|nr:anthrone oxygenase family protein [Flavimobilis marinus]GHG46674.1 hypothetical protein GCM10011331_06860 [Flavimobilis marinus]SFE72980.1 Uncharacterized membrane protein [Flavimobilis marinus]